jgi:hypothetical protein
MAARPLLLCPRTAMRALIGLLMATTLVIGSGCAKRDWIDRTLVTVDVTGGWQGTFARHPGSGYSGDMEFVLEQRGAKVTGAIRFFSGAVPFGRSREGVPIEGTVSGDTFSFQEVGGSTRGEFKVNGDEMIGWWARQTTQNASLRRQQ